MSQLRSGDAALMQELGDFPDDDLKVELVEKECRTIRHSVPEGGWVIGQQTGEPIDAVFREGKNKKQCFSLTTLLKAVHTVSQ